MTDGSVSLGVFGAGAWGTALALAAARAGCRVLLVGRDPLVADLSQRTRQSPHLAGVVLDPAIDVTADMFRLQDMDAVVLAVPAQATREAIGPLAATLRPGTPVVSAAKGIDRTTGGLITDVIAAAYGHGPVAVLSGPGFASEVALGLPTAVTVAAEDFAVAKAIAICVAGPTFRPYTTTDVIGVQLGGALKNVLAIAAGVVAGRRLGASAEAAVITRGFAEMRRLAAAMGARPDTLMGLSGLGDLVLTCRSAQSRNYSLGLEIGGGGDPRQFGRLAEGAATAAVAVERAGSFAVEVPIMSAVADVLDGSVTVDAAVDLLLARPLKRED
ncbi:MAG TPA: NAD(P)H-dependent glycerol-3-phosphate dehydrogenase [Methylomirabilota bacterium]|nr:NAD(P)H-dependent glycerol-3-phosphate dehydrogenase [Methylomirabilota bacterium]